ncbi:hypothetical protein VF21_00595 [Pseudogymnoascus sp. 05NY08]|nr:hypothetical protein VF21_00595 [Pseudogymnoascus sp. 05NY08]
MLGAVEAERPEAAKNIHHDKQAIIPSSIGEHSSLEMTILEGVHYLEFTSTILIGGRIVPLDLLQTILASWAVREAEPCDHPADTPLEPRYNDAVLTTSVASPSAIKGKIAIVQVSRNPVAQLLACVPKRRTLLQPRPIPAVDPGILFIPLEGLPVPFVGAAVPDPAAYAVAVGDAGVGEGEEGEEGEEEGGEVHSGGL